MDGMAATLATAALGSRVRVDAVEAEHATRRRLAELGIRPGARVDVLSPTSGGGRVVAVSEARIALDRATAAGVTVTPAPEVAA